MTIYPGIEKASEQAGIVPNTPYLLQAIFEISFSDDCLSLLVIPFEKRPNSKVLLEI